MSLTLSGCGGLTPVEPPPTALDRLLGPLGIAPRELGILDLSSARDPWRLRIVDHVLARPLDAVALVRGVAGELRESRGELAELIRSGARYLDLPLPHPAPTRRAPRPLIDVLWSLRAESAAAALTRADLERRVQRVPADVQPVLADLLEAMIVAAPMLREASAALSDADRSFLIDALSRVDTESATLDETPMWRLLDLAARVDRARLLAGAVTVGAAVDHARTALVRWREAGKRGLLEARSVSPDLVEGDVLLAVETTLGLIVVGGAGPTIYRRDAALIVDLGGNDRYESRAGGTADPGQPISVVIDLDGDDRYVSSTSFAQGAAAFGVGILMDLGGHDTYVARDVAQGAALFGVGVLLDTGGNDRYEAAAYAQGAGFFGVGALVDDGGDDHYDARIFAQAFGGTGGLGVLLDEGGNDTYVLAGGPGDFREPDQAQSFGQGFAMGIRPVASGGIGLLADHAGNDRYTASYFAQGTSYWLGLGGLVDDAGDDRYEARRYAQGAGIHLSVGVLWDGAGDDEYRSWGASQGCGHDLAVGILADAAGSDRYVSTWLSQGVGSADALGLLLDLGGTDHFVAEGQDVQGYGTGATRAQSLGLFVKLAGSATYSGRGRPDSRWDGVEYGGGLDARGLVPGLDLGPRRDPMAAATRSAFGPGAPAGYARPADPRFPPRDETARAVQASLLRLLDPTDTPEANRTRAEARGAIQAMGPAAVPALVDLLGVTRIVVAFEVIDALTALGEAAHPALVDRLDDASWLVRRRAAYVLARRTTPTLERRFATMVTSAADPVLRATAIEGLARSPLPGAAPIVADALARDPDTEVRVAAAIALKAMAEGPARQALTRALEDPAFSVRLAARKTLAALGP